MSMVINDWNPPNNLYEVLHSWGVNPRDYKLSMMNNLGKTGTSGTVEKLK